MFSLSGVICFLYLYVHNVRQICCHLLAFCLKLKYAADAMSCHSIGLVMLRFVMGHFLCEAPILCPSDSASVRPYVPCLPLTEERKL